MVKPKKPDEEDFSDFFSFEPEPDIHTKMLQALSRSNRLGLSPKIFVIDEISDLPLGSMDRFVDLAKYMGKIDTSTYGTRTGRTKSEHHPPLHNLPKRK